MKLFTLFDLASRFEIEPSPDVYAKMFPPDTHAPPKTVTVERRGKDTWAVVWLSHVWSKTEEWLFEPMPSSRTDEFKAGYTRSLYGCFVDLGREDLLPWPLVPRGWAASMETPCPDEWVHTKAQYDRAITVLNDHVGKLEEALLLPNNAKRVLDTLFYVDKTLGELHGILTGLPGLFYGPDDLTKRMGYARYRAENYLLRGSADARE